MWQQIGPDEWTADGRRMLLHVGDVVVELHETTVHVYTRGLDEGARRLLAVTEAEPEAVHVGSPLDGWRCVGSVEAPETAPATEEQLRVLLATYAARLGTVTDGR